MGEETSKPRLCVSPPEVVRYNKLRGQAQAFAIDIVRYLEEGRPDLVPKITRLINQICRDMEKLRLIIKQ